MKHASLLPLLIGFVLAGSGPQPARGESKDEPQKKQVMVTREYETPLDFFESANVSGKNTKERLESWGLPFPEGATASFNVAGNRLVVHTTEENLEILNYLVDERRAAAPCTIVVQCTVIEGPGRLMRESNDSAARKMSASKELETLLAKARQKESGVRVVGDTWLETQPYKRVSTESVRQHTYASRLSLDDKSRSSLDMEMRPLGLRLELTDSFGTANESVHLRPVLDLFPAPQQTRTVSLTDPTSRSAVEFPVSDEGRIQFATELFLFHGDTKILGIAKPVGKAPVEGADVLWMAFITAKANPIAVLPEAPGQPLAAPDSKLKKHPPESSDGDAGGVRDPSEKQYLSTFFTLHTVQAPAHFLRALAAKAAAASDHAAVWQEIEAAAARGEASFIDSHALQVRSGQKAENNAARELAYPASFITDGLGRPGVAFEMRPVGSLLSLEPVLSEDEHTIRLNVDYELHTAPPEIRRDVFRDPGSKQTFEVPMTDFHVSHLQTAFTLPRGGTRLLTLWEPAGHVDADILWATFLHGDVVRHREQRMPLAENEATPLPEESEWVSRVFRVPPDFEGSGKTAQQILEDVGISFPQGARAYINPKGGRLIVRNQRKQIYMVEGYLGANGCYGPAPRTFVFTTQIIQAPGVLIRRVMSEVAARNNHRPHLDQLLASAEVRHLGISRIETKSGRKVSSEEVLEHNSLGELSQDEPGLVTIEPKMRKVGFLMSLDATGLSDGSSAFVELTTEFHTAAPLEHREHLTDTQGRKLEFPLTDYHAAKISTDIVLVDGTARLIGVWKPTGKPEFESADLLQAAFITCDVLPVVSDQQH